MLTLLSLGACHTMQGTVAAPVAASCPTMRVESSRQLEQHFEPTALIVDYHGNPHLFLWHLTGPANRPRRGTYSDESSDGRNWTRKSDLFPGIHARRGAHFAYQPGEIFAAVETNDGGALFTGVPWREVARLPHGVKAMRFGRDGLLRVVTMHCEGGKHSSDRGTVFLWRAGALEERSSFEYAHDLWWNGHYRASLVDGASGPVFVVGGDDDSVPWYDRRYMVVRDLDRQARAEIVRRPPGIRAEHARLEWPDGKELVLASVSGGGDGSCPSRFGWVVSSVERCTPEPEIIPFEGESALVERADDMIVLGSLWRDTSDAVQVRPRCGNDTRPERGLHRQTGARGSGQLLMARVVRGQPRLTSFPIETTYPNRVMTEADRYGRVHAIVLRERVRDDQRVEEAEYVRLGCGQ